MNVTQEQKAYHLRKMRTRFRRLDLNEDGLIGYDDFVMMADKIVESSSDLSKHQKEATRAAILRIAVQAGFKPNETRLNLEEAAELQSDKLLAMSKDEIAKLHDNVTHGYFDVIDTNGDGHISLQEYKVYFSAIAPGVTEKDVERSFQEIDTDKNGEISREEWLAAGKDFFHGVEPSEISETFFGPLVP